MLRLAKAVVGDGGGAAEVVVVVVVVVAMASAPSTPTGARSIIGYAKTEDEIYKWRCSAFAPTL